MKQHFWRRTGWGDGKNLASTIAGCQQDRLRAYDGRTGHQQAGDRAGTRQVFARGVPWCRSRLVVVEMTEVIDFEPNVEIGISGQMPLGWLCGCFGLLSRG